MIIDLLVKWSLSYSPWPHFSPPTPHNYKILSRIFDGSTNVRKYFCELQTFNKAITLWMTIFHGVSRAIERPPKNKDNIKYVDKDVPFVKRQTVWHLMTSECRVLLKRGFNDPKDRNCKKVAFYWFQKKSW